MSFNRSSNFPDYGSTNTARSHLEQNSKFDVLVYNQLCDEISCNIFSIINNVTGLEKAAKEVGSHSDTPLLREKIHNTRQGTKELVNRTTSSLKDLTNLVAKGERSHRLQAERVCKEFHATVQRYDVLQKVLDPKMKLFSVQTPSTSNNVWNTEEDEEQQALIESEKKQQYQVQEELEFEQELLLDREANIRKIESDILDVNTVFRELATMVYEQGTTIGTIEDNITATAYNVEGGHEQLLKARNYQSAYRKKLCCFVLILLIVAVIVAIVVAVSLNSS